MSITMSVEEFYEFLKSHGIENVTFTAELRRPGGYSKHDLADGIVGCNYPPYGHKIVRMIDPEEYFFEVSATVYRE